MLFSKIDAARKLIYGIKVGIYYLEYAKVSLRDTDENGHNYEFRFVVNDQCKRMPFGKMKARKPVVTSAHISNLNCNY